MSDLVLVASIQGIVAVIVIVLGAKLNGKVNQVRQQVDNGHTTNMREEADHRFYENRNTLVNSSAKLDQVIEELEMIRQHIRRLWSRSARHTEQLDEIDERTQPHHTARHPERSDHE